MLTTNRATRSLISLTIPVLHQSLGFTFLDFAIYIINFCKSKKLKEDTYFCGKFKIMENNENINNEGSDKPNNPNPLRVNDEQVAGILKWLSGLFSGIFKHNHLEQWIFTILVSLILGTIITLGVMDKITESTIGTLLGSAIGYALGKYSNHKGG